MADRRNQFDRSNCLERGDTSETLFKKSAIRNGWEVLDPTGRQNIDQHWDFLIQRGDERFRVDVKALKKISRHDAAAQDSWIWIELHGVRESDAGWLFAGKADLLAFEKINSFIIVRRWDLINLVQQLVDFGSLVLSPDTAQYKVYQRSGRPDKITLIESKHLDSIKWDQWEKI
jgi:hypothetical protein